jgi:hypothetical protein
VAVDFEFIRGNLVSAEMREQFKKRGPYDLVLFIGLSCWLPKLHLANYLKFIRYELLAPGGILFTDCFTPGSFALSGHHLGYKANYYDPAEFTGLLAYCGFDPASLIWKSGLAGINHVCLARTIPGRVEQQPAVEPVEALICSSLEVHLA